MRWDTLPPGCKQSSKIAEKASVPPDGIVTARAREEKRETRGVQAHLCCLCVVRGICQAVLDPLPRNHRCLETLDLST
jgi:hypothetical protein